MNYATFFMLSLEWFGLCLIFLSPLEYRIHVAVANPAVLNNPVLPQCYFLISGALFVQSVQRVMLMVECCQGIPSGVKYLTTTMAKYLHGQFQSLLGVVFVY